MSDKFHFIFVFLCNFCDFGKEVIHNASNNLNIDGGFHTFLQPLRFFFLMSGSSFSTALIKI